MKAAILNKYDKKDIKLAIRDIPVPVPEKNEVLVKIFTASVNPLDNMIIRSGHLEQMDLLIIKKRTM